MHFIAYTFIIFRFSGEKKITSMKHSQKRKQKTFMTRLLTLEHDYKCVIVGFDFPQTAGSAGFHVSA